MKIAITGATGLLGWHSAARIHAQNCAAKFKGEAEPYQLIQIDRNIFQNADALAAALKNTDIILHFAGVNRGPEDEVEAANPAIADQLVTACQRAGIAPALIYANSTHAANDSFYGRSKRIAGEKLAIFAGEKYCDIILPHIFGECARPYYNNVTATLIDQIWKNEQPDINPDGKVELLHAGAAAQLAIDTGLAILGGDTSCQRMKPQGRPISVIDLFAKLQKFHDDYSANIFPNFADDFELALFNSYRTGGYPAHYPKPIKVNSDNRGILFESAKGGDCSQSFISTTLPGQKRGDHFHLDLVERFLVVAGNATIRVRKVLTDEVQTFHVSGDTPVAIDMPPLHTHHIENEGDDNVITYFWAHHLFDPKNPDTFADAI
ncbi:capsule biosynthesis protein CapF [Sphingorhabdus lutea]|uniref:Capsule biosynthesis protein CapF n=1 Tax=Sphingorhabdus lutea TaxID=1913578 RepID=A0A1L3JEU2_9SPHN|nr:capsule biosynthesis protein CapF [Sphingorhabdus lutea]